MLDQVIFQFETEKNIIFNHKRDLVLVECTTQAKLEGIDIIYGLMIANGGGIQLLLMSEKMYETDFMIKRSGFDTFIEKAAFNRLDQLRIMEEENDDTNMFLYCSKDLQAIQDKRDAEYFIKLLARKEEAV